MRQPSGTRAQQGHSLIMNGDMSERMSNSEQNALYAEMRHCGRCAGRRLRLCGSSGGPFNFLPRVARRSSPSCSSEHGLPFYPPADGNPFPPVEMLEFLANTLFRFFLCSCFYFRACLVSIAAVLVNHSLVQFFNSSTEPVSIPSILYAFTKKSLENVLYKTNCCPGPGLVFRLCCVRAERLRLRDDANFGRHRQRSPGPGCGYLIQLCCICTCSYRFIVGVSIR